MAENIMSNTAQLLNFNDIIGAIQDDNDYGDPEMSCYGSTIRDTPSEASSISHNERNAYVKIIEEPQPKALRFRYICEGRSAGSIPGIHSTQDNKTYPAIKIVGYKGKAVVVVSCVTVDPPHKPHPHNLVGKESCNKGVCTITIKNESMECVFSNLGIQCVKKKDVEQALRLRKEIRVDPFGTGFSHINQTIDLNAVRLCFQVFIAGRNGEPTIPLKPVVSEPIYDKKATSDLNICKLSHCTSCVSGGQEIILLCDKVSKEDIQIRFFEEKDGQIEWEALGEFSPADVHKQVAITFKTPKYKNLEVINPVSCFIQLQRISDKMGSDPRRFEYLPMDAGRPFRSFKRLRNNNGLFHRILGLDNPLGFSDETLTHKNQNSVMQVASANPLAAPHVPQPSSPVRIVQPSTSKRSPTKLSLSATEYNQSLDDIKQRMTASLNKNKSSDPSPQMTNNNFQLWADDASNLYSDNDILDEVLSQGSVNDILSGVGEGLTVYEDVDALTHHVGEVNPEAIDALYGDASYASCYSNLEFAMGRATKQLDNTPSLPIKKSPIVTTISDDEDFNIYSTPSGRPIHQNKEDLLRERGFLTPNVLSPKDTDNNCIYMPVSDIMEEDEYKEIPHEDLPQTILDLFV